MLVNGENYNVKTLNLSKKDNVNKRTFNVNERIKAKFLVEKFEKLGYDDAEKCYSYFVKCFKMLPECTIWNIYESTTRNPAVKSKIKYFIGACRNQMATR